MFDLISSGSREFKTIAWTKLQVLSEAGQAATGTMDGAGKEVSFCPTQQQIVNVAAVGKMFPSKQATYIFWPLLLAADPS